MSVHFVISTPLIVLETFLVFGVVAAAVWLADWFW